VSAEMGLAAKGTSIWNLGADKNWQEREKLPKQIIVK